MTRHHRSKGPYNGNVPGGYQIHGGGVLKKLNLTGNGQITRDGLHQLTSLVHLNELSVEDCRLGDAALTEISSLVELRKLNLSANEFSITGLRQLKSLVHLTEIRLEYCGLDDSSLTEISCMRELRVLILEGNL